MKGRCTCFHRHSLRDETNKKKGETVEELRQ